jgi:lipopolysaccharide transport protein LptA
MSILTSWLKQKGERVQTLLKFGVVDFFSVVVCCLPLLVAHVAVADFVDELPLLPVTPAPAASPAPRAKSSSGNTKVTPKNEGKKTRKAEGGNNPSAEQEPSAVAPSGKGGILGSDTMRHNTEAPISTQGDELEGSLNTGKMTLNGNVQIRQDDTLMKSDMAEVYTRPGTSTPERAVAKGRVSILKRPGPRVPEIRATADELEYFVQNRIVVLKGKPKIWRGKELLQGEVMELALDTGDIRIRSARSVVDPRSQQEFNSPKRAAEKKK